MSIIVECVDSYDDGLANALKRITSLEKRIRKLQEELDEEKSINLNLIKKLEIQITALEKFSRDTDKKYDGECKRNHGKIVDLQQYVFAHI